MSKRSAIALVMSFAVLNSLAAGATASQPAGGRAQPALIVVTPAPGQLVAGNKPFEIRWVSLPRIADKRLTIRYSPDNGTTWRKIDGRKAAAGKLLWKVPKIDARRARLIFQIDGTDDFVVSEPFKIDSSAPESYLPGEIMKEPPDESPHLILGAPLEAAKRARGAASRPASDVGKSAYDKAMDAATELMAQRRFIQARSVLRRLAREYPRRAEVFYFLARSWRVPDEAHSYSERQKPLNAAIFHLRRAVELDPEYVEAWNDLGLHYAKEHDYEKAREALAKAVALRGEPYQNYNLALVLVKLEKPEEAVEYFREALRMDPKMKEAHWNLGAALESIDRLEDAMEHWNEAARLYGPQTKYGAFALEQARRLEKEIDRRKKESRLLRLFKK